MCIPPLLTCILCRKYKELFSPSGETQPVRHKPKGSSFFHAETTRILGTIYLGHGYGMYGLAQRYLIRDCRRAGYNVVVWDMPGHGSRTGKLTHIVQSHEELVDQVIMVFRYYNERCGQGLPAAFIGSSTGAVVNFLAVANLRKDAEMKKWIRCLVGIGAAFHVGHNANWYMRMIASPVKCLLNISYAANRLLQRMTAFYAKHNTEWHAKILLPLIRGLRHISCAGNRLAKYNLPRNFSPKEINDDAMAQDYLEKNPRIHRKILPFGWALSIFGAGKLALKRLGKIDLPILLLHGEKDEIALRPALDSKKHGNIKLVERPGKHDVVSGPSIEDIIPEKTMARLPPNYKPTGDDHESRRLILEFLNTHMK